MSFTTTFLMCFCMVYAVQYALCSTDESDSPIEIACLIIALITGEPLFEVYDTEDDLPIVWFHAVDSTLFAFRWGKVLEWVGSVNLDPLI